VRGGSVMGRHLGNHGLGIADPWVKGVVEVIVHQSLSSMESGREATDSQATCPGYRAIAEELRGSTGWGIAGRKCLSL